MTKLIKPMGKCNNCEHLFTQGKARLHIEKCFFNPEHTTPNTNYLIKVHDHEKLFWIFLLVPAKFSLAHLDNFLRELWVECCGHLSAFTILDKNYSSSYDPEFDEASLNVKIKNLLWPDLKFSYQYDFGSTTYLKLEVLGLYKHPANKIELLMRNELPQFNCHVCKAEATLICSFCKAISCDECTKKDECQDEDSFLPIPNSPRMSECGYI